MRGYFQKKLWLLLCFALCTQPYTFASSSFQKTRNGGYDFYSVLNVLLTRFAHDLNGIDSNIQKVSPFKVSLTGNLPASFRDNLLSRLEEIVINKSRIKIVKCVSCFKTSVTNEEQTLVVRRGIRKGEELQDICTNLMKHGSKNKPTSYKKQISFFHLTPS